MVEGAAVKVLVSVIALVTVVDSTLVIVEGARVLVVVSVTGDVIVS